MKVPLATRRLFPEIHDSQLESDMSTAFVASRLLEVGDSNDLIALFSQCSEDEVCRVFLQRGCRQVDHRSRAFWSLLFAQQPIEGDPIGEALWPL